MEGRTVFVLASKIPENNHLHEDDKEDDIIRAASLINEDENVKAVVCTGSSGSGLFHSTCLDPKKQQQVISLNWSNLMVIS